MNKTKGGRMNKQTFLAGVILITVGILALMCNLTMPMLELNVWRWGLWRLWPLVIVSVSIFFLLPPLLVRGQRALGALFIPGMPILTTGAILLFASVFDLWSAWEWLWPLEVLALAEGFLFAAVYTRVIWLVIPSIIIGANGLVLQFCALTGLWGTWSVLWTIEPLSVGLALLMISAKNRSAGLFVAGVVLCGLAGMGLIGMAAMMSPATLLPGLWLIHLVGPALLVLSGLLLMVWVLAHHYLPLGVATEKRFSVQVGHRCGERENE
jgi:hypothetical protein